MARKAAGATRESLARYTRPPACDHVVVEGVEQAAERVVADREVEGQGPARAPGTRGARGRRARTA